MPHLTSLRTQFVHIFVNGEDYGVYTWVEAPASVSWTATGLDPLGQLYKAAAFSFQALPAEVTADPRRALTHHERLRVAQGMHRLIA